MARRPTIVDLFSGGGGFSFGFAEEGFEILTAVEKFRTACETYASNVVTRDGVLNEDVRSIAAEDFAETPDVLIGGPPCEAFTVSAKERRTNPLDRLYKDPRGSMTVQFILLVKAVKPRHFVMENVPGILDGPLADEIAMLFARAGFPRVFFNDLLAEDAGTPSHRRRVFVSDLPLAPPREAKRVTVREAIGDIADLEVDLPNHVPMPIRGKRAKRMAETDAGESVYHYRTSTGAVHGAWTRLRADELAPTIMGSSHFIHYEQDRLLTPREHARLMGYPDDYVFRGSKTEQYEQAGESVPPPLARAIAREVKLALAREKN